MTWTSKNLWNTHLKPFRFNSHHYIMCQWIPQFNFALCDEIFIYVLHLTPFSFSGWLHWVILLWQENNFLVSAFSTPCIFLYIFAILPIIPPLFILKSSKYSKLSSWVTGFSFHFGCYAIYIYSLSNILLGGQGEGQWPQLYTVLQLKLCGTELCSI